MLCLRVLRGIIKIVKDKSPHEALKMNITECYQLLEIEPTDSLPDAKQAYRDIVFVWHPDRMTGNTRVQKKAESKLKRINVAYEQLQSSLAHEVPKLTKISIYPQQIILDFGERYTFSVIGLDQNGNEVELDNVTWKVSGGGTIYAEGSFFADYESGEFNVVATSKGISNTATIVIKEPNKVIEVPEETKESSKTLEYKYSEAYNKTSREPEFELGIDFPWKRLIFWGLFTFFYLTSYSQNLDFSEKVGSLLLLMWIVGLIIPDILLTFDNYFNTRASVTQLYFCSSMLIACLSDGTHTLWVKLSTYLSILWFIGMINPEATINFGLETRWAITGLCIFMGLLMGAIWGGLQGISLAFSG
jgi:DnaJ domain